MQNRIDANFRGILNRCKLRGSCDFNGVWSIPKFIENIRAKSAENLNDKGSKALLREHGVLVLAWEWHGLTPTILSNESEITEITG
jgi:hypothetical protein